MTQRTPDGRAPCPVCDSMRFLVGDERLRAGLGARISDQARAMWQIHQRAAQQVLEAANVTPAPVLVDEVPL